MFAPVRQHARTLRQDARLASLPLSDLTVFGGDLDNIGKSPPGVEWLKGELAKHVQSQQWIQQAGMPSPGNVGGVPAPFPGPKHLPSLFFERLSLEYIPTALAESVHREMLLLNPDNGIFDGRLSPRRTKEVHVQHLIALLGGVDMQFTKLHRNQGHGSFEHARVHLWARLPLKELGRILHDGSSPWHELPKRCLLWELLPKCDDLPEMYSPDESWQFYDQLVHKLIQARCFPTEHTDAVIRVPSPFLQHFQSWEHCFRRDLLIGEQKLCCDVAQHRDFFATMLWALSLFQQRKKIYWCVAAAYSGAIHSIRRHLDICDDARAVHAKERRTKIEVKLTGILQKHGPSTLRKVLRSTDKLKAADLRPVFEHLTQQGRVSQDAQKRYVLIKPQASSTLPAG
ncbi:hypothetical protein [Prosthecobacter sp.]|uniref:hypothetical protein n=1 Tax=Prosthecobacter sp. TaxID=1965333 RepID=UPI002ABB56E4|nr:hypothetical protein [Prosthecobacter sp.]MDZ4401187.1 hypothetical protein [Prosthecobacter sp.]